MHWLFIPEHSGRTTQANVRQKNDHFYIYIRFNRCNNIRSPNIIEFLQLAARHTISLCFTLVCRTTKKLWWARYSQYWQPKSGTLLWHSYFWCRVKPDLLAYVFPHLGHSKSLRSSPSPASSKSVTPETNQNFGNQWECHEKSVSFDVITYGMEHWIKRLEIYEDLFILLTYMTTFFVWGEAYSNKFWCSWVLYIRCISILFEYLLNLQKLLRNVSNAYVCSIGWQCDSKIHIRYIDLLALTNNRRSKEN